MPKNFHLDDIIKKTLSKGPLSITEIHIQAKNYLDSSNSLNKQSFKTAFNKLYESGEIQIEGYNIPKSGTENRAYLLKI